MPRHLPITKIKLNKSIGSRIFFTHWESKFVAFFISDVNVGRFSKLLFCNMKLRGSTASQQNNNSHVSVTSIELYKDQYFLLNFIMSTYLGPDVFSDNPRCSVAQRLAEGLSPYSSKNLGVSFVSLAQLESLYYYVLKNAHPSLVMNPSMLYMYLKGELPLPGSGLPEKYPQFTSYFPMNIHAQKRYSGHYEIVKGIVLIDDPVTSYMKNEDLERFKRLSGMDHLKVDKVASLLYQHGRGQGKDEIVEKQSVKRCDAADCYRLNGSKTSMAVADGGKRLSGDDNTSSKIQDTYKRTRHHDPPPVPTFSNVVNASSSRSKDGDAHKTNTLDGPAVMQLLPVPNMDTFMSSASITLNGTATKGIVGPPIGVVDIGVSEPAYFFRVALPGIRRDYCEFSCEIESNGRVHIQGSTSGGKVIRKRSRVFQMKFQQLCPPGPFTVSFSLPGPVDPRLFSPNFRSDGIFEGVVIKNN